MDLNLTPRALLFAVALMTASVMAGEEARLVKGLDFRRIDVLGSVSVKISQGDKPMLKMWGDPKTLDRDPFYLRGDRLILGMNPANRKASFSNVKFLVELPDLRELRLRGSGEVYVKPFELSGAEGVFECSLEGSGDIRLFSIDARKVELRVNGTGDIKAVDTRADLLDATVAGTGDLFFGHAKAREAAFVVTGSGDIAVVEGGSADVVEASVVGSGDISMKTFSAGYAEVRVVGAGSVNLGEVSESVDCSILGSGDVRFDGKPQVDSVQLGAGECRSRD